MITFQNWVVMPRHLNLMPWHVSSLLCRSLMDATAYQCSWLLFLLLCHGISVLIAHSGSSWMSKHVTPMSQHVNLMSRHISACLLSLVFMPSLLASCSKMNVLPYDSYKMCREGNYDKFT